MDLSSPEIEAAWAACRSGEASFLALGYAPGSKKKLAVIGSGTGGFGALRPLLAADAVVYAACEVQVGGARKLAFVCSVGEATGGMAKGRASMHKQDIENSLDGTVGGITVSDEAELEPAAVAAGSYRAVEEGHPPGT